MRVAITLTVISCHPGHMSPQSRKSSILLCRCSCLESVYPGWQTFSRTPGYSRLMHTAPHAMEILAIESSTMTDECCLRSHPTSADPSSRTQSLLEVTSLIIANRTLQRSKGRRNVRHHALKRGPEHSGRTNALRSTVWRNQ